MLKQLKLYYVFVSLPFVLLLGGSAVFLDAIKLTISRNPHPQINYTIFAIILFGGVTILFNARRLMREARTIVDFSGALHSETALSVLKERANNYDGDLACISQMVATSGERNISHQEQAALEHELANVRSRLSGRNALPQYLTGLLVGMGLLGTFIGLLATLNDISVLISSFADLDMSTVSPILVFRTMIERMKAPMQSMAIAFSASMFGLLGSIILGLMMVGIRRLQNDIFSLLSSEVARHVETALSFEGMGFRNGALAAGGAANVDLSTEILLRIEERLAESARIQQRALTVEIDDFKTQRADMMRTLIEQTEASNKFRSELQQLGAQLGSFFSAMEKDNGEISAQISELTVHITGDAKKSHNLLAMQVSEQRGLKKTLVDDFNQQRSDMVRALVDQNEVSSSIRTELQQLGGQLVAVSESMEKGTSEISSQISELTVQTTAAAKQSQLLLNNATVNFRGGLQQFGKQLAAILAGINKGASVSPDLE